MAKIRLWKRRSLCCLLSEQHLCRFWMCGYVCESTGRSPPNNMFITRPMLSGSRHPRLWSPSTGHECREFSPSCSFQQALVQLSLEPPHARVSLSLSRPFTCLSTCDHKWSPTWARGSSLEHVGLGHLQARQNDECNTCRRTIPRGVCFSDRHVSILMQCPLQLNPPA